ncbi:unnamed protein product [Menidia menidia]|uniref:Large ribosomal subunit protein bL33m n=1 Tax=Menidia menidia TaxID=238744 RepID=A0A8S4AGZ7_9TELE|nr:unnamed protein product [Menidia menidia]
METEVEELKKIYRTLLVQMVSAAGTGYFFNTKRNRLREKLVLRKHDPFEEDQIHLTHADNVYLRGLNRLSVVTEYTKCWANSSSGRSRLNGNDVCVPAAPTLSAATRLALPAISSRGMAGCRAM